MAPSARCVLPKFISPVKAGGMDSDGDNLTIMPPLTHLSHQCIQWNNQLTASMHLFTGLAGAPAQPTPAVDKKLKQLLLSS